MVRSDQGDPDEQQGDDRERRGGARPYATCRRRRSALRRVSVTPEPPRVAAERLAEQSKRAQDGRLGQSGGHDICSRNRQDDPLSRGDDLAPVAGRQRRPHPRPDPPGCEERIARQADREDPRAGRAGDVHAEDEDQEGIDLTVELRAQLRRGLAAPCDPSVDRVERERDGRERHQRRDVRGLPEGVGDQRRDADGERRPSESHPIRRAQAVGAVPANAADKCRIHDGGACDSDDPAGCAEADRRREGGDHRYLGDDSGRQESPNRVHRASVFVATWDRYGRHGAPVRLRAERP